MTSATSVAGNVAALKLRIEAAARRAGRDAGGVSLIGVTKGVAPAAVADAIDAGLRDFGENFVREAEERRSALGALAAAARWHFIGHLQSNKAGPALRLFDVVQSVDSLRLAQNLSRRATRPLRILLEVNVAAEASKFGFAPSEVSAAVAAVANLPGIQLEGLMTIAPAATDAEAVRPVFRELRRLAEANGLSELSMGMSDDFEVAIEEGATMVRLGRAVFGERR
jgi:pyridoxal phosphate enzyme (YggS family)